MLLQLVLLAIGLILLVKGADWLVDGAKFLAKKKNVSDLAIGLTIVAFGTSAPEWVVNVVAAYEGHDDIVFGNIIGSNNFNLLFILGVTGLIRPLFVQSSTVRAEIPISFFAAVLLYFLGNHFFIDKAPVLSRIDGIFLLVLFCFFLYYVYRQTRSGSLPSPIQVEKTAKKHLSHMQIIGRILGGLLALILGGRLIVAAATEMAVSLGVTQEIIGLTIVAAGTSLPELATSVVATLKKNNDIAVGNIVGSNIFNILFILGCSALIRPIDYNTFFNDDLYLLMGGTVLLFLFVLWGRVKSLNRWEAGLLLTIYISFTLLMVLN